MATIIRKARLADSKKILKIINHWANKKALLPRSLNQIYDNILGFYVAEHNKVVVGCCSLSITWDYLAEIRSLAVDPKHLDKGLGRQLVMACEAKAKKIGVKKLFALTYIPNFFKKLGFKKTSLKSLPHKIWSDCINCPYFPNCNEVALIKRLR